MPFIAPNIAPLISPVNTDKTGFIPLEIMPAVNALDKANVDPIDKSMPPVNITKVIPKAIKPFADTCLNKFNKLFTDKKLGLITDTVKINTNSANKGPNLDRYTPIFFDCIIFKVVQIAFVRTYPHLRVRSVFKILNFIIFKQRIF